MLEQQDKLVSAFKAIATNKKFQKILGFVLKIGNCMNAGNKQRGQADGFNIDDLGKTQTLKDGDGKSMLQFICYSLHQEDLDKEEKDKVEIPENDKFINFKADFDDCYFCLKVAFDDVKKDTNKAASQLTANKNQFENLLKIDPDIEDLPFGKQIQKFLIEQEPKVK